MGSSVIPADSNRELSRLTSRAPLLVADEVVGVFQGRHSLTVAYLGRDATTQCAGSCLEVCFGSFSYGSLCNQPFVSVHLPLSSCLAFSLPLLSCRLTFIWDCEII